MTEKKWITGAERKDRRHALKLARAEQQRTNPMTGDLRSTFTLPEIGAVIGLKKNTIDDIERQALKKVRTGLVQELGIEGCDIYDVAISKALIKHMAVDRHKESVSVTAGDEAMKRLQEELPYRMLLADLRESHQTYGTLATWLALREQLKEGALDHDERTAQLVRGFTLKMLLEFLREWHSSGSIAAVAGELSVGKLRARLQRGDFYGDEQPVVRDFIHEMVLEHLRERHGAEGTLATVQGLREGLQAGNFYDDERQMVEDFIKTIEEDEPNTK